MRTRECASECAWVRVRLRACARVRAFLRLCRRCLYAWERSSRRGANYLVEIVPPSSWLDVIVSLARLRRYANTADSAARSDAGDDRCNAGEDVDVLMAVEVRWGVSDQRDEPLELSCNFYFDLFQAYLPLRQGVHQSVASTEF
jgi:hypothetical protein